MLAGPSDPSRDGWTMLIGQKTWQNGMKQGGNESGLVSGRLNLHIYMAHSAPRNVLAKTSMSFHDGSASQTSVALL